MCYTVAALPYHFLGVVSMTKRDIAFLGCRIVAILVLLRGLWMVPTIAWTFGMAGQGAIPLVVSDVVARLLIAAFFWTAAGRLSRFAVSYEVPGDSSSSLHAAVSATVFLVGSYFLTIHLVAAASRLGNIFVTPPKSQESGLLDLFNAFAFDYTGLVIAGIWVILQLCIMLGARRITDIALGRRRLAEETEKQP
jgi:hypothetical protein